MKNWENGISAQGIFGPVQNECAGEDVPILSSKKFWSARNSCNPKNLVFRIELNRASSDAEFDTDSKYHIGFSYKSISYRASIFAP